MLSIEHKFSDKEGNHLLVALCFCDDDYKQGVLRIPEEYTEVEVVDISITKAYVEKPVHHSVFFRMSSWLIREFDKRENAVFTFICSTDGLHTNPPHILPQDFRWELFDKLYRRRSDIPHVRVKDIVVGPEGYQAMGRAFFRDRHAPLINIIAAGLREK